MSPQALYQFITALGAGIGGACFAYLTTRRFLMRAVHEEAGTYERLLRAKSIELGEVAKRLDYLEQLTRSLEEQNRELRELNVSSQRENLDLRSVIDRLQSRIGQLESGAIVIPRVNPDGK